MLLKRGTLSIQFCGMSFLVVVHAALKSGRALLYAKNNLPRKIINTFLILSLWNYSIGKNDVQPWDRYPKTAGSPEQRGGHSD